MSPPHLGENLCEIPSGEEMGFERGIKYSEGWRLFMRNGPGFME